MLYSDDGKLITDLDIELDDIVIQAKSGSAKKLTMQMINTANATGKTVISYTPDINQSAAVLRGVSEKGFKTFTTTEELLEYLGELYKQNRMRASMQWITLIGDEKFDMDTIKSIKHDGCIECNDVPSIEGRYCVNFGEDHIFYDYGETPDDFEDDLSKIPYANPHFITMIYTSKSCVRRVLKQNNFPANIYIDNDCGLILPLAKFVQQGMPLDMDDMLKR